MEALISCTLTGGIDTTTCLGIFVFGSRSFPTAPLSCFMILTFGRMILEFQALGGTEQRVSQLRILSWIWAWRVGCRDRSSIKYKRPFGVAPRLRRCVHSEAGLCPPRLGGLDA